jgi:hypothetical protein
MDLFNGTPPPLQFGDLVKFDCGMGIVDQEWLSDDPDFARASLLEDKVLLLPNFEGGTIYEV